MSGACPGGGTVGNSIGTGGISGSGGGGESGPGGGCTGGVGGISMG
jgi:hypothetical protein